MAAGRRGKQAAQRLSSHTATPLSGATCKRTPCPQPLLQPPLLFTRGSCVPAPASRSARYRGKGTNLSAVEEFKRHDTDCGSPEYQIARLSARVAQLTAHLSQVCAARRQLCGAGARGRGASGGAEAW